MSVRPPTRLSRIALLALLVVAAAATPTVAASAQLDGPVTVTPNEGQTITGQTSLDAGTNVSVRVQSAGDTEPRFYRHATVTVGEDGTFGVGFDFSGLRAGDTFTVSVVHDGEPLTKADGKVVEKTPTPSPSSTETTGPGFGVAAALAALAGAVLLTARR